MPILKIRALLGTTPNGDDRQKKTTHRDVKYTTLYINNDLYLNNLFFLLLEFIKFQFLWKDLKKSKVYIRYIIVCRQIVIKDWNLHVMCSKVKM